MFKYDPDMPVMWAQNAMKQLQPYELHLLVAVLQNDKLMDLIDTFLQVGPWEKGNGLIHLSELCNNLVKDRASAFWGEARRSETGHEPSDVVEQRSLTLRQYVNWGDGVLKVLSRALERASKDAAEGSGAPSKPEGQNVWNRYVCNAADEVSKEIDVPAIALVLRVASLIPWEELQRKKEP